MLHENKTAKTQSPGIAFAEYRVLPARRGAYIAHMNTVAARRRFDFYEGADQPGLFVELWPDQTEASFDRLRRERTDASHPDWAALESFVDGGASRIRLWRFIPADRYH